MFEELAQTVNLQELATQLVEFMPRFFIAVGIVIAAIIFFRVTRSWLNKAFEKAEFDRVLISLLVDSLYRYTVLAFGLIMAIDQLGVNVAAALAGVGVAGIAIGFAAQDSVANVISGILIFWDKPFVVGDWITTEGQYGKVTNITLRTTRIRTPRNTFVVVPNKRIIDELLENHSKHGELRVDVPIGIAYKEDIREAREVLLGAVDTVEQALDDPRPDLVVDELGGSSVNLKVRVWVASADDQRKTYYEVTEKAKLALDKGGIEIPFPHLQLYVDNVEDNIWAQASELATGLRKAS
jgi:small conductance mechanosensitive channel